MFDEGHAANDPTAAERARPGARIARVVALAVTIIALQGVVAWGALSDDLEGGDLRVPWLAATLVGAVLGAAVVVRSARGAPFPAGVLAVALAVVIAAVGATPIVLALPVAQQRAERALSGWVARPETDQLERDRGYSVGGTQLYPQVSRTSTGDRGHWVAAESDRTEGSAPLAADARGVLVLVGEDRSLSLDRAHVYLGARGAREPGEIAWVGLISRVWPVSYEYEGGGSSLAERVDVRIVDVALDEVVARVSIGAVPPDRGPPVSHFDVGPAVVARAITAALDEDGHARRAPDPPWSSEGCDLPTELHSTSAEGSDACIDGATAACDRACRDGSIEACADAGYALDHASAARARPYYALACRAGSANACTNFGAGLLRFEDDPEALACARRMFERTCDAGEYFGCGMLGGMLARGQGGDEDDARAHAILEASCAEDNAFSCEALGRAISRGELEIEGADGLAPLRRACELGRAYVCRDVDALAAELATADP